MDERLKKVFKLDKESSSIILLKPYMEVRIPDSIFTDNIGMLIGNRVHTIGYLELYYWDDIEDKETDKYHHIQLRLPTLIITEPDRIRKVKKEYILEYYKGDKFLVSTLLERSAKVVSDYTELLFGGKLPDDIPYDMISKDWAKCCQINNVNLRVNYAFMDLIVTALCRNPENSTEEFRRYIEKHENKPDMLAREMVSINRIPAMTSQFAGISSENPKLGVTATIGAARANELSRNETPIEGAIK